MTAILIFLGGVAAMVGAVIAAIGLVKRAKKISLTTEDNKPLVWPGHLLPLLVTYRDPRFAHALTAAAHWWNVQLGRLMFIVVQEEASAAPEEWTVGVIGVQIGPGTLTATRIRWTEEGAFRAGPIVVGEMVPTVFLIDALKHELGHVLGLAHDEDDTESIMAPKLDTKFTPKVVRAEDLKWLRSVYPSEGGDGR
jgi:hypothetical protein